MGREPALLAAISGHCAGIRAAYAVRMFMMSGSHAQAHYDGRVFDTPPTRRLAPRRAIGWVAQMRGRVTELADDATLDIADDANWPPLPDGARDVVDKF